MTCVTSTYAPSTWSMGNQRDVNGLHHSLTILGGNPQKAQDLQAGKSMAGTSVPLMVRWESCYHRRGMTMCRFFVAGMLAVMYLAEGWGNLTQYALTHCKFLTEWCDVNSSQTLNTGSSFPRLTTTTDSPGITDTPTTHGVGGRRFNVALEGTLRSSGRLTGATLGMSSAT